ncbi:MAG: hypothetical protein QNJ54_00820 [Prochloraceae cyanobacterium]|nr:hypothetical protein [Prochloraceae cyanobacterium]
MADLSKESAYAFAVRWPGEEKYYMSYETDSGWCRQNYETRNDSQFILVPEDEPRKNVFLVQNVYPDSSIDKWLSYSGDNLRVGLYSAKSDATPWEFVRTDNSNFYKLKCLYEGKGKNKWLSFQWDGRWNYLYTNESDACPYQLIIRT